MNDRAAQGVGQFTLISAQEVSLNREERLNMRNHCSCCVPDAPSVSLVIETKKKGRTKCGYFNENNRYGSTPDGETYLNRSRTTYRLGRG